MFRGRVLIIWCGLWLAGLASSVAEVRQVRVGAGVAPVENVFKPVQEPFERATGIKLVIIDNGPVNAIKDLDRGLVDVASGALPFNDWMAMMAENGYPIADRSQYAFRVIGADTIKFITHRDNRVARLTKPQLRGIFSGTITNWREVGGPDLAIVVVFGSLIPGTNKVVQNEILDGSPFTTKVLAATNGPEVRAKVAETPGAIGFGALALVDDSVWSPETPELGRPIVVVTKARPSPDVESLIRFIQGEGRKYVVR